MARDDAETGRPKAAIPADYQPAPDAGGRLTNHFLSVDVLRTSPLQGSEIDRTAQERDRHNLGAGFIAGNPDQSAPGYMLTGAQVVAKNSHIAVTDQRRRDDENRLAITQMQAALDARLAALDAELLALDTRIGEIEQRRIEIGDNLEAIDELEQIERSGQKLDPNNPAHAALLRRAGIDPDKADKATVADIIARRRRDLGLEDGALGTEWDAKMKRRAQVARERIAVAGGKDEIENADTVEARILAERRAETILGAQQVGEAVYQSDDQRAKLIGARAVAANEIAAVRSESGRYNDTAVADVNQLKNATDATLDWAADPSKPAGSADKRTPPPAPPSPQ